MKLPMTRGLTLCREFCATCTKARVVGLNVWEWMHHCVEVGHHERGRMPVANTLLCGIVERDLRGATDAITIDTNRLRLLWLGHLYLRVTPLGLPRSIGNEQTVAVTASPDSGHSPDCATCERRVPSRRSRQLKLARRPEMGAPPKYFIGERANHLSRREPMSQLASRRRKEDAANPAHYA